MSMIESIHTAEFLLSEGNGKISLESINIASGNALTSLTLTEKFLIMAGHSKWANIKHRKAHQDARKGKIFTKIIREIVVAAKNGDPELAFNPKIFVCFVYLVLTHVNIVIYIRHLVN